jgi:hypothetical protein
LSHHLNVPQALFPFSLKVNLAKYGEELTDGNPGSPPDEKALSRLPRPLSQPLPKPWQHRESLSYFPVILMMTKLTCRCGEQINNGQDELFDKSSALV